MDAWETLTENSTITVGDAWDHLNSQGGDGGEPEYIFLYSGVDVHMENLDLVADIVIPQLVGEVNNPEMEAEYDDAELTAEVCA